MLPSARRLLFLGLSLLTACASRPSTVAAPAPATTKPAPPPAVPPAAAEEAPPSRLPEDVRPTAYVLALEVLPERETFSGTIEIAVELGRPRQLIWLHGRGLRVREAQVEPVGAAPLQATWEQASEDGIARLRLPRPVGPGRATLRITYEAPFDPQLGGLYHVSESGAHYAFTQFEPIYARRAFPGFDEPVFKTPFDLVLTVPAGQRAIANQPEVERTAVAGGRERVRFARTPPLPTYLVAFAVGPFDIVDGPPVPPSATRSRPVPLRGVAVRGKGPKLAYALRNTGAILTTLEQLVGIGYPYDKLDIIAVPDFPYGAMENPGAITFIEQLLLIDERTAPLRQRRSYADLMGHELAHMWFGDLVTMPWWDDVWLNEAFATWMGGYAIDVWRPDHEEGLVRLLSAHGAMERDMLASTRQVRQPIASHHDIDNAFDSITYEKGGQVLAMFERWLGRETFARGVRRYLEAHRGGNATTGDFLSTLSAAAGRDVTTPFHTFLDQPGLPLIEAQLVCGGGEAHLALRQSRSLPVGSTARREALWQVPVCARYESGGQAREACVLLDAREGKLPLAGAACPRWVMPNADAVGYYHWSLAPQDLKRLREAGYAQLSVRERLSLAESLRVALVTASLPASEVLGALAPLVRDPHHRVVDAAGELLAFVHGRLAEPSLRGAVEQVGRELFRPAYARLGWGPGAGPAQSAFTPAEERMQLLRGEVIRFLFEVAHDPEVRREAARRGRTYLGVGSDGQPHPEAVAPELVDVALAAALAEGGAPLFDTLVARLDSTTDAIERERLIGALGSATDPRLAARARALALDGKLRKRERDRPLFRQLGQPETREQAWAWLVENIEKLAPLLPATYVGFLPEAAASFCDAEHIAQAERLFTPLVEKMDGAPRTLAQSLEDARLCAALAAAQGDSLRSFFRQRTAR